MNKYNKQIKEQIECFCKTHGDLVCVINRSINDLPCIKWKKAYEELKQYYESKKST